MSKTLLLCIFLLGAASIFVPSIWFFTRIVSSNRSDLLTASSELVEVGTLDHSVLGREPDNSMPHNSQVVRQVMYGEDLADFPDNSHLAIKLSQVQGENKSLLDVLFRSDLDRRLERFTASNRDIDLQGIAESDSEMPCSCLASLIEAEFEVSIDAESSPPIGGGTAVSVDFSNQLR